ncbi:hypothetical protein QQS21_002967 [Conoideocrella luteorostrata]|uniref:Major facilitator superfamily (MFS) profile domain-containing protein n=1 Tax=Conoideocrella luteorostrata TaxID=1105319 RepID=A0AAJ0CU89_9HYPO|nr:hypothetical protein QQS21_002967 [Conoideocrella luteorostrata]
MMFLPKIFAREGDDDPVSKAVLGPAGREAPVISKTGAAVAAANVHTRDYDDSSSEEEQDGVKKIEATVKVWSSLHIYLAYIFIWIIYFADSMHSSMAFSLTPYVTSSFAQHGLTATTGVFAQLIGALIKLPLAKILDIWGRPQGFALTVFFMVVGLIMMAACQNVQTYAAAQVFYWIGFNGVGYSLQVFIADTSELKNRAFAFAFINSPFIITAWTSGPAAEAFLANGGLQGWRWAFGTFCIVVPVVTAPIFALFLWNNRKAKRMGVLAPKEPSGRNAFQSIKHYCVEFDVIGLLLAAAGMALFLLPFNIFSYQAQGWRAPMIICMIVFGVVLLVVFALYEKFLAPVKFIPFKLLVDRTVMGACILVAVLFIAFYIWDAFFSSFLQVVVGLTVTEATYVGRIYNVGSCFWGLVVGVLIRWTGRFKWLALYFGVPVNILGVGLMIHFRQGDVGVGYIVMAQIFIAIAGGTLVICEQMAVMAAVSHKHVAVVLALLSMFSNIGGAIGGSVSAAIWNGVFPPKIYEYLPAETQGEALLIIGNITKQLSYPNGSPTRVAIVQAYGEAQKIMMTSATSLLVLTIVAVGMWRDIKVKDFKRDRGVVA